MKKHNCITAALAFAVLAITSAVSADTVFNFGPATDYVTADQPLARNPTATGTGATGDPYAYTVAFSDTNALSPTTDYTGPRFFGGYTFTSSSVQGRAPAGRVLSDWSLIGTKDAIRIYADAGSDNNWNGSTLGFASVFIFKQADFSTGYATGDLSLDGFSVTYRASSGNGGTFIPTGRWLVQIGNTCYLSDTTITANYNLTTTASLTGAALSATQWAAYNPATSINFDQTSASFTALELSQVTAIGIYFEQDSYAATTGDRSGGLLAISTFSATGSIVPIPEPSRAMLLLALAGLAAMLARKFIRH